MEDIILIRYGELNTKGRNKKYFINKLESNITKSLKQFPNVTIEAKRDRMFVISQEYDVEMIVAKLKKIFGIQNFSLAKRVACDIDVIEQTIMDVVDFDKHKLFKVITKRADKTFPIGSDDVNRRIATKILKETPLKVSMKDYDLQINIEIRREYTYIFFKRIEGAQGFPLGISGKGLLMLSGGIDSPVAGYLTMKRGVSLTCIHFASPPYTSQKSLDKVIELASKYLEYTQEVVLYNVPFTNLQLEINKYVDATYSMTILRRMMYRVSEKVATLNKCDVLINGESIAQVASQTLKSMSVINEVTSMPIIRPLACFDKLEIIDIAKKIDTYETSILPFEDCCTVFLPKNPVIEPKLEKVLLNESFFDFEPLINDCINNIEKIVINEKTIESLLMKDEDIF